MTPRSRARASKRPKPNSSRPGAQRSATSSRAQPPARGRVTNEPAPSPRYTPSRPSFRIRPTSHKIFGWVLVALGFAVAVLNDIQWVSSTLTLLPGGHSELYLMLAIAVAALGAWWLGLFDRPSSSP